MNVRLGWSGDIHGTWTKMDVEVDENDLTLHFIDAGVGDPYKMAISPIEKFKLMYSIAETFVQLHKMSRFPDVFDSDSDRSELQNLVAARDKRTRNISDRNSVSV